MCEIWTGGATSECWVSGHRRITMGCNRGALLLIGILGSAACASGDNGSGTVANPGTGFAGATGVTGLPAAGTPVPVAGTVAPPVAGSTAVAGMVAPPPVGMAGAGAGGAAGAGAGAGA